MIDKVDNTELLLESLEQIESTNEDTLTMKEIIYLISFKNTTAASNCYFPEVF